MNGRQDHTFRPAGRSTPHTQPQAGNDRNTRRDCGQPDAAARDVGEIHWILFWPEAPPGNPCWPDANDAADALITACIHQLERWGVTRQHADGDLPVRGIYGVPEQ